MAEQPIYGTERIAGILGISESTLRRWRKDALGSFLSVASMSNHGGGLGVALVSYPSSLTNLKNLIQAQTSAARADAANVRWHKVR